MFRTFSMSLVLAAAAASQAEILFSDNFESGTFGLWTRVGTTTVLPAVISQTQANSPIFSAFFPTATTGNVATDRYAATFSRPENVGAEAIRFSFWQYDSLATGGGRMYCEVRSYDSNSYGVGALEQLYAMGKNNSVTATGDVYNGARYQGRGAFSVFPGTSGWFNMNTGVARSIGWHHFEAIIGPNSIVWLVDGVFARLTPRGANGSLDSIVMGSVLGSDNHDTYWDDIVVEAIPFAYAPSAYRVVSGSYFGGDVNSLRSSDDDKLFILNDENGPNANVEFDVFIPSATLSSMQVQFETSATRSDLTQFADIYNFSTSAFVVLGVTSSTQSDATYTYNPAGPFEQYLETATQRAMLRLRYFPNEDLVAEDGWSETIDQVQIFATP